MPDSASTSSALRSLGRSSLVVTPLAWAMWRFEGDDLAAAQARVEAALEAGIVKLNAYRALGAEAFILSGYPHGAEPDLFARHVLPRLDHGPLTI